jgi:putative tricarboxylic transport membrane protein
MQRLQQVLSLGFFLLALYVMRESMLQDYWLPLGPGPGFFPFWLGLFMAVLAVVWFVQASIKANKPAPGRLFPRGVTLLRVISVPLAVGIFPALGEQLGFRITMLAFLLFMLSIVGRQKLPITLAISLAGSIGGYYVFHDLLGLFLPVATVDLLRDFEL